MSVIGKKGKYFSHRFTINQIFIYGIIGAVGTACHYLVMISMVEIFIINPIMASCMGFIVGAFVNHELNRKILFKETLKSHLTTAQRFFVIATIGFFINLGIMFLILNILNTQYVLAQFIATVTVFFITFFVNKTWTFGL